MTIPRQGSFRSFQESGKTVPSAVLVVGFANYRIRKSKIEAGGSQAAGRGCAVPAYAACVRVRPRILPPKRLWLKLLRIPSLPTLNVSHGGCVTCHLVLVLAFVLDVGAGARVEDGITPAGRRMPSQVSFSRLTIKIKMLPTSRMQNMKACHPASSASSSSSSSSSRGASSGAGTPHLPLSRELQAPNATTTGTPTGVVSSLSGSDR